MEIKIKDFSIKTGIEVSFKYKGELSEVTFSIWKIINENLEEALTNIMKYSKASRVDIAMEILNKTINGSNGFLIVMIFPIERS